MLPKGNSLFVNVVIISCRVQNSYGVVVCASRNVRAQRILIPKNHSLYLFPCNTFFVGHLVVDEKASRPRIF